MKNPFVENILRPIYHFLISLKLAVVLIACIMVTLMAGTIIESLEGAAAAKILVYNAPYFSVLLVLLGANVLAVALSRLPWKKKHIGFVITHCGVLLILAGSLMTRNLMIDGQIALQEGEQSNILILPDPMLQIHSSSGHSSRFLEIPQKPFPWQGREKISKPAHKPLEIFLLTFYPKARISTEMEEAKHGPGALEVRLHNDMVDEVFHLEEDGVENGRVSLGPAQLSFSSKFLEEPSKTKTSDKEGLYLEFQIEGKKIRHDLPLKPELPMTFKIEGTPYQATLTALYRQASVSGKQLVEAAASETDSVWQNPAVKLTIEGDGVKEEHTSFARFPDFETIHGHQAKPASIKVLFHAPGASAEEAGAERELRFVKYEDGRLFYQIKTGDKILTEEAALGKDITTQWMGLTFRVEKYFPHVQYKNQFEPVSNTATADGLMPAIQLEVRQGDLAQTLWLVSGEPSIVSLGHEQYQIVFGQKRFPLGFSIRLKDFKKQDYPGTNKAASFSSDVELIDSMRGVQRDVTISMNEPLDYRGFKFYQSAYRVNPGEPEVSIFSVGKDPGVPVNYLGAIVLVTGILTMIVNYSRQKRKERKK